MHRAAAARRYKEIHEDLPYHDGTFKSWAKAVSDSHPFHYDDGVTVWVSQVDLTPDDDFLEQSPRRGDVAETD